MFGRSKLITWLMPSTSMPRAAMSVATKRAQLAVAEGGERALALVLRLVAVDRLGGEAGLLQGAHDLVGAVLGAGEDQHAVDRLGLEHLGQQRGLRRLVDVRMTRCVDLLDGRRLRRHRDADRIAQDRVGEPGDFLRHGGREEQRLPFLAAAWRRCA